MNARWAKIGAATLVLAAASLLPVRPDLSPAPGAVTPAQVAAWTDALAVKFEHDADGVACTSCHQSPHGGTDGGASCANCHTPADWKPSTFTVARHAEETEYPLVGKHADVSCARCHPSSKLEGMPTTCAECHIDRHRGKLGGECASCHSESGFKPVEGFDHAKTGFALIGPHAGQACASCHEGDNGRAMRSLPSATCATCHEPAHGDIGADCATCHDPEKRPTFASARGMPYDHRPTGFPLERRHAVQKCGSCHAKDAGAPIPRCDSCHVDPHGGQLGSICEDCHRPDRWRLARYDHDETGWPLRGRHFTAPCASCHTDQRWIGLTTECFDCHAQDALVAPSDQGNHGFGRTNCGDCHTTWSFNLP